MKKVLLVCTVMLTIGLMAVSCSKDELGLNGTKWISTYSSECWWENNYLDGDFTERISFSSSSMRSQTLKNGSVYRNNWTRDYSVEDNVITDDNGTTYYVYDDVMYRGMYVFYKE